MYVRDEYIYTEKGKKIKNKVGLINGEMEVVEYSHSKDNRSYWKCRCSCGKVVIKTIPSFNRSKSCGHNNKFNSIKHGMSYTRIYNIWENMKSRCYYENNTYYYNYGGRGIKMCDEWVNSFEKFYRDMHNTYEIHVEKYGECNTTIERIDVDGDYCLSNCKWATRKEQSNNTRYNSGWFKSKK